MDSTNNGNNKPSLNKTRGNTSFGHATVAKSDVGDFQEGYFVMAELPSMPHQQKHKTHKTPERNQRKNEHSSQRQHNSRERSTKDIEQLVRESDIHVSNVRLPTSPARSPLRNNKRNQHTSPQHTHQTMPIQAHQPLSPQKPRKAHHVEKRPDSFSLDNVSGSPSREKGPSPPPASRWAGPAFSNAPPPSSLPMPEFLFESTPTPQSSIMSSSPPHHSGFTPAIYPKPQFYIQPPLYAPLAYPSAATYSVQLSYAAPEPQNLVQLSTDLRKMLNISQPILA